MAEADRLAVTVYQRLAAGDPDGALEAAGAALAAARERPGLEARLQSWIAQAHLQRGQPQPALAAANRGLKLARALGDPDGIAALEDLARRAAASAAALQAPRPPEETPLSLAVSALDEGRSTAEILALGALAHARQGGGPREIVLALLALARIPRRAADAIAQAQQVADESGDPNLVTAVARAAAAADLPVAPRVF